MLCNKNILLYKIKLKKKHLFCVWYIVKENARMTTSFTTKILQIDEARIWLAPSKQHNKWNVDFFFLSEDEIVYKAYVIN